MLTTYNIYNDSQYTDIPMLQRDYVQGLDANSEKRDPFLRKIFDTLASDNPDEPLSVDFIYGSTFHHSDSDGGEVGFRPIDGQQRLTTFAMVGWLLAQKAAIAEGAETAPSELYPIPQITYRTRHSTRQFVELLRSYTLPKGYGNIREHLEQQPIWMAHRWLSDPSISAMLDLLVKADAMLSESAYEGKIKQMADRFYQNSPIRFEKLDMENYGLTEDLYIKMNARGKHLTDFENWKAEFTDMLEKSYKNVVYPHPANVEGEWSIPEYFSYAIEHHWTDLLWGDAYNDWNGLPEDSRQRQAYPTVDVQFLRLLGFFSLPAEDLKVHYRDNQKNVEMLFGGFDALWRIHQAYDGKMGDFFKALLYSGRWDPTSKLINTFDEGDVDLFQRCIDDNLTLPMQFLFKGLIKYCVAYPIPLDEDEGKREAYLSQLRAYLRVVTGWMSDFQYRRTFKILGLKYDLRPDNFPAFEIVTDLLLHDPDVNKSLQWISDTAPMGDDSDKLLPDGFVEGKKDLARELQRFSFRSKGYGDVIDLLMGCHYLKGEFRNVYPAMDERSATPMEIFTRFVNFYQLDEYAKTRTLLHHGWEGTDDVDKRPNYPFYGKNGHWDYVLTTKEKNLCDAFTAYLTGKDPIVLNPKRKEYYVDRYEAFYNAGRDNSQSHLFSTSADSSVPSDFYMTVMGSNYSYTMLKYRYCPYATAVFDMMEKLHPAEVEKLELYNSEEKGDHGCLRLNCYGGGDGKFWIECVPEGWRFDFNDGQRWHEKWRNRFDFDKLGNWSDRDGEFHFSPELDSEGTPTGRAILQDKEGLDRVELCAAFLQALAAQL